MSINNLLLVGILLACIIITAPATACVPPTPPPALTVTASPAPLTPVRTPTPVVTAPPSPPPRLTIPATPVRKATPPPAKPSPSPPPAATPRPTLTAPPPAPAATPGPALAAQVQAGRTVFSQNCARCHGASGEGTIGPRLIGPGQGLAAYATAAGLFDFVSKGMPMDAPGSLTQENYLNVLAFILQSNGYFEASPGPLSAGNLAGISLAK